MIKWEEEEFSKLIDTDDSFTLFRDALEQGKYYLPVARNITVTTLDHKILWERNTSGRYLTRKYNIAEIGFYRSLAEGDIKPSRWIGKSSKDY